MSDERTAYNLPQVVKGKKIGFAFIPQKATEAQVDEYLQEVKKYFPACVTMVSALPINGSPPNMDKPFLDIVRYSRERQGLVARFYPLLGEAKAAGLDYLVANIRMLTYPAPTFLDFAVQSLTAYPAADLVIGEPQFDAKPGSDFHRALDDNAVRQRLLADTFINFVLSSAAEIRRNYMNMNAGMFCIRVESRDVLHRLQGVRIQKYTDSALVCPLIAWHLLRAGDRVEQVPVRGAKVDELTFNLEKAISEIEAVFQLIRGDGIPLVLSERVSDFFAVCEAVRFWAETADKEWFSNNIVGRLKKKGEA